MGNAILIFFIGFFKVAARAFQQKNVTSDKWLSLIPTSYVMSTLELATIGIGALEASQGDWVGLVLVSFGYGTGAWMGCMVAMWLHNKIHKK